MVSSSRMESYWEEQPSASHSDWVECVWGLQSDGPVADHRVPPDGCLDIVYDRRHGLRAIGAMNREQRFAFSESATVIGVRFRPGMSAPFLHAPASELTDGSAPLQDLWPRQACELARRMDDARSVRDAMRMLLGSLPSPSDAPNPVQRAIGAITAARGNADLDSAAWQANLSPRQFRRRCLEESGLTPKRLSRVLRFRYACRLAGATAKRNWSDIALEAGYFDQAHLIGDFKSLTGLTPMSVFSNTRA